MSEEWEKYKDIIELDRPKSPRQQMSSEMRAAQFAPFATLRGHDEAVMETSRLTDRKIELEEEDIKIINENLNKIKQKLDKKEECNIIVTYYKPDEYKEGGEYITINTKIKKIKEVEQIIVLEDDLNININDLYEIEIIGG